MWEMIQDACTVIVGIELLDMIYIVVSICWESYRDSKRSRDKGEPAGNTRICQYTSNHRCIHDDDWCGQCSDCSEQTLYQKQAIALQQDKRLKEIVKKSVREVMEEE